MKILSFKNKFEFILNTIFCPDVVIELINEKVKSAVRKNSIALTIKHSEETENLVKNLSLIPKSNNSGLVSPYYKMKLLAIPLLDTDIKPYSKTECCNTGRKDLSAEVKKLSVSFQSNGVYDNRIKREVALQLAKKLVVDELISSYYDEQNRNIIFYTNYFNASN